MQAKIVDVQSNGILSINTTQAGELYLDVNGEPGYLIKILSGTCGAILQRVGDVKLPLSARALSDMLADGLQSISQDIIDTLMPLLPKGKYILGLIELSTRFYSRDQEMPHPKVSCVADYFWYRKLSRIGRHWENEVVLPLTAQTALDPQRVDDYVQKYKQGVRPTALALSMIDLWQIPGYASEWILAHFLIDGHHKMMAASQLGLPITILSALSIDQSLETLPHSPERDSFIREHYKLDG